MTTAFQSDAFQNDAFQIDAAVIATTINQPAGGIATGPAFPRKSVRELYRQLPQQVEPDQQTAPETSAETPVAQLTGPSPLPIMMNLGNGPVMVGMNMPSLKQVIEQQLIQDDEDAITAILLSI